MPKIFVCDIPFQLIVSDYLFFLFGYISIFSPLILGLSSERP